MKVFDTFFIKRSFHSAADLEVDATATNGGSLKCKFRFTGVERSSSSVGVTLFDGSSDFFDFLCVR
jgi:hypothetical protein